MNTMELTDKSRTEEVLIEIFTEFPGHAVGV